MVNGPGSANSAGQLWPMVETICGWKTAPGVLPLARERKIRGYG